MSTSEEQGWVPATYLESQSGIRDDSEINMSKGGEGKNVDGSSRNDTSMLEYKSHLDFCRNWHILLMSTKADWVSSNCRNCFTISHAYLVDERPDKSSRNHAHSGCIWNIKVMLIVF